VELVALIPQHPFTGEPGQMQTAMLGVASSKLSYKPPTSNLWTRRSLDKWDVGGSKGLSGLPFPFSKGGKGGG